MADASLSRLSKCSYLTKATGPPGPGSSRARLFGSQNRRAFPTTLLMTAAFLFTTCIDQFISSYRKPKTKFPNILLRNGAKNLQSAN